MIPKIIHYCWIGSSTMPATFQQYIAHWKEVMPDWQFMEWNDSNIKELITDEKWTSMIEWGYKDKKHFGLLSDLVRYTALVRFGGFYVDTDVEIFKPFDIFLNYKNVFGYIFDALIGTAIIGAEQGSPIYQDLLNYIYQMFENEHRLTVSNVYVTKYICDHVKGFLLNGRNKFYNDLIIFTKDTFERYSSNKNTGYSWHHCDGSWRDKRGGGWIKRFAKLILGKRLYYWIVHKYCMYKATFKNRYKHDIKIDKTSDFIISNGQIKFLK